MILTCPNCAARYTIPDEKLGPAGRQVRCGNCGHEWQAMPADHAEVTERAPLDEEAWDRPAGDAGIERAFGERANPSDAAAFDTDYDDTDLPDRSGAEDDDMASLPGLSAGMTDAPPSESFGSLPGLGPDPGAEETDGAPLDDPGVAGEIVAPKRNVPAVPPKPLPVVWRSVGWGGLALFWAIILGSILFAHERVAQAWPASQTLFDAIGLGEPAPPELTEKAEDVLDLQLAQDADRRSGQEGYFLTATVTSFGEQVHRLPDYEAVLMDNRGEALQRIPVSADRDLLEPGETAQLEAHVRVPPVQPVARWEVRPVPR